MYILLRMNQKFHREPIPVRVKDNHRDGHQERVQNALVVFTLFFRVIDLIFVDGVEHARAQYPNGETREPNPDVIRRRKRRKKHHFFSTLLP